MAERLGKKLKFVFDDGFLMTKFFGEDFENNPRFFDTIYNFSIFGKIDSVPIEGALEWYYEKVEVDAFREFLINWEPKLADYDPHNLPLREMPKIIEVVKAFSFEEKRQAISQFYGGHFVNVINFLSKWISEIPDVPPYKEMVANMTNLREFLHSNFRTEDFEQRVTEKNADLMFNYWTSSSANYITKPFGPFGIIPFTGIIPFAPDQ